ncbi:MAG: hypothetical protein M0P69_21495 [Bacteroidales bacterium]|nr:hypothetical protein [Bacteroidales bacterium]
MNQARIYNFPTEGEARQRAADTFRDIRLSSVERRELTEDELRARYSTKRRAWDTEWTGTEHPPWHLTDEERNYSNRPKHLDPPRPWYKGLMDGTGVSILFLVMLGLLMTIFAKVAKMQGW